MKSTKEIIKDDKQLIDILVNEAKTNDKKIMVYPYDKKVTSNGQISFKREWHVMREGNKTSKKFINRKEALHFAGIISKTNFGKVHISR